MESKLTLKLDQQGIETAKRYASKQQVSLSKMVESYLKAITTPEETEINLTISPFVKSMSTDKKVSIDIDTKAEYQHHLLQKWL